jgi:hypothetical protein
MTEITVEIPDPPPVFEIEVLPGIGDRGPVGDAGAAATITVGTVTTGEPGTSASVVNSGTSSAAVLDITIPRGDVGATGSTGSAGAAATVTIGTVTTGEPGTSASVTNSGTSSAAVLDITIPRGAVGDTGATGSAGATGAAGAAATITVGTVTTGDPGTSVTVTNSGTSSAAVFDITIPRGATGNTGPANTLSIGTVTTGAAGSTASATITGTAPTQTLDLTIPRGDTGNTGAAGATGATGGFDTVQSIAAKTDSYTLVLSDAGKLVTMDAATDKTVTVPPNSSVAFSTGQHIDLARLGTGAVTVAAGSGVTVNATPGLKLRARYSTATLIKIGTDSWLLVGDISA